MLYKQARLFKLTQPLKLTKEEWQEKLSALAFRDCPPSMPQSLGWIQPVGDEHAPLLHMINGYVSISLQIEEKILPSMVIRHELQKKIKMIESRDDRKVYQKEKNTMKDELFITLLPRAFSKFSQVHAYIDTNNQFLVLGTTNEKRTEQFLALLQKTIGDCVQRYDINKLSPTLTHWLQHQSYPSAFAIEKACVLQDQNQTNRVIRCQHQDLFATSIQTLIKDGCEVKQIAMDWQDHITFVLVNDFSLQSIRFKDELISQAKDMEAETAEQKFIADFFILTESLSHLFTELLKVLSHLTSKDTSTAPTVNNVVAIAV